MSKFDKDFDFEELTFHCRSPIFMCAECKHAVRCQDLLNLLRLYSFEEKKAAPDYSDAFPFIKPRPENAIPDRNNKLNALTSSEWLRFTRTVVSDILPRTHGHDLRRRHPDYKNHFLMGQLIAFFTKPGQLVLDPFAGTGSALTAASLLGRDAVGFELHKKWIDIYYEICAKAGVDKQKLVQGDAVHLSRYLPPESVDFVIVDPPNVTRPEEWMGPEGGAEAASDAYFTMIEELLLNCRKALSAKKYLALFARNLYQQGSYIFLTPHFAAAAENAGFVIKGEKIWENKGEKLRPYGYPSSYVPNIVHYTILIFQKKK